MIQKQFNLIRIFFILGAIVLLITAKLFPTNHLFIMTSIALVTTGTIGLAHGGLDWSLGKLWGLRANSKESMYFALAYLLCIMVTLTVWHIIPSLALLIFLLMSIVHFAGDWRQEMSSINAYILGVAVICLPTLNFYGEVNRVFELLLSSPEATWFTTIMYYLAMITSLLLGINLIYLTWLGKHSWMVMEVLILMLIGISLTPLVYFGIYFCFLHAPKHWLSMREIGLYNSLSQGICSALWPTFWCILTGVVAIYYSTSFISYSDALCKTVFIGLASLTVPHWILIEIYGTARSRKQV